MKRGWKAGLFFFCRYADLLYLLPAVIFMASGCMEHERADFPPDDGSGMKEQLVQICRKCDRTDTAAVFFSKKSWKNRAYHITHLLM